MAARHCAPAGVTQPAAQSRPRVGRRTRAPDRGAAGSASMRIPCLHIRPDPGHPRNRTVMRPLAERLREAGTQVRPASHRAGAGLSRSRRWLSRRSRRLCTFRTRRNTAAPEVPSRIGCRVWTPDGRNVAVPPVPDTEVQVTTSENETKQAAVKPPAQPTLVRTQHLPHAGPQHRNRTSEPLPGPPAGAPSCPATSDPHRPLAEHARNSLPTSRSRPSAYKVHGVCRTQPFERIRQACDRGRRTRADGGARERTRGLRARCYGAFQADTRIVRIRLSVSFTIVTRNTFGGTPCRSAAAGEC